VNAWSFLKRPSGFLPVTMSAGALGTILVAILTHGPAPQVDEGAAAHLWQLLMAAQRPIIGVFLFTGVRPSPRRGIPVLALQPVAALAAAAPVFFLGW
jgi:hypothetical protein